MYSDNWDHVTAPIVELFKAHVKAIRDPNFRNRLTVPTELRGTFYSALPPVEGQN